HHPEKRKEDWPGWASVDKLINSCFLCRMAKGDCDNCLGTWGPDDYAYSDAGGRDTCESIYTKDGWRSHGLYTLWLFAWDNKNWGERIRLAQLIRDIVKED
ncbi:hypothetical protein LCGC14_1529320, partial [marine sediment metagenome]